MHWPGLGHAPACLHTSGLTPRPPHLHTSWVDPHLSPPCLLTSPPQVPAGLLSEGGGLPPPASLRPELAVEANDLLARVQHYFPPLCDQLSLVEEGMRAELLQQLTHISTTLYTQERKRAHHARTHARTRAPTPTPTQALTLTPTQACIHTHSRTQAPRMSRGGAGSWFIW